MKNYIIQIGNVRLNITPLKGTKLPYELKYRPRTVMLELIQR